MSFFTSPEILLGDKLLEVLPVVLVNFFLEENV